jgi:transcriptional regulator with XRE-family HTH domain
MVHEFNAGIPPGFGSRLKEERKRLKFSQTAFAGKAGLGRLAQVNYEVEATAPTVDYLSAVGAAGADLRYLIFGIRSDQNELDPATQNKIEIRAFELIEAIADKQLDGRISAETRRHLFHLIKGMLIQIETGNLPDNYDPLNFLSGVAMR